MAQKKGHEVIKRKKEITKVKRVKHRMTTDVTLIKHDTVEDEKFFSLSGINV